MAGGVHTRDGIQGNDDVFGGPVGEVCQELEDALLDGLDACQLVEFFYGVANRHLEDLLDNFTLHLGDAAQLVSCSKKARYGLVRVT